MSTVPTIARPERRPESVEELFRELEAKWIAEVGVVSDPERLVSHPAFREIVRLGEAVIPYMMKDLEQRPRLWVWALPEIAKVDGASEAEPGNIRQMTECWLRWGKANGYR